MQLSSFWQKLTAFQRLSLISILFFLVVLPVAIWLAMSPTSPFSRAGGGPITSPIESPPPLPVAGYPAGTLSGPVGGTVGEELGLFAGNGKGENLAWVRIYWAPDGADLSNANSWTSMAENDKCNGASPCSTTGSFTPKKIGDYHIAVNANADFNGDARPCSGNPYIQGVTDPDTSPVPGWVDCGAYSRIIVSIREQESGTVYQWYKGYNLVGMPLNKGQKYTPEEFLKDLNSTFTPDNSEENMPANPIRNIFRYNTDTQKWEVHTLGKTNDDNFPVQQWEGYFVQSLVQGVSPFDMQGRNTLQAPGKMIPSGWSLVSTPWMVPEPYNEAEPLLQLAKKLGLNITSIWRLDGNTQKYAGHRIGSAENNFKIGGPLGDEAYWIYNDGPAKPFSFGLIPIPGSTPSPLPSSIPLPPLPQ